MVPGPRVEVSGKRSLPSGLSGGEPCGQRMRGAGADDNHVGGIEGAARAVGMNHGDLRPGLERDARASGEGLSISTAMTLPCGPVSSARMAV